MPGNRTGARNVKLFISDELNAIGGLVVDHANPHITNSDFLDCLSVLVVADPRVVATPFYRVFWHNVESSKVNTLSDLDRHPGGSVLEDDESLVKPGVYVVHPLRPDSKQQHFEAC
jgi:hypothetical protein